MALPTIMVVEDNRLNRDLIRDLLECNGFVCVPCRGPGEALEALRGALPSLILMDIQLPEMSGLELTERIKSTERTAHIPIVAVTAFAMQHDERQARLAGCDAYITKPVSIDDLLSVVRRFVAPPSE